MLIFSNFHQGCRILSLRHVAQGTMRTGMVIVNPLGFQGCTGIIINTLIINAQGNRDTSIQDITLR
jgi:hypothetical protein